MMMTTQPIDERVIYFAEHYVEGKCQCSKSKNKASGYVNKSSCELCLEKYKIFVDDKFYPRLVHMFTPHRVFVPEIQDTYIVCGKNFQLTKETLMNDRQIHESELKDLEIKYEDVEIVEAPEKINFAEPIYDELPQPISFALSNKRSREEFYFYDSEEEETITFYDGITGEPIDCEPMPKRQKTFDCTDLPLPIQ